MIRPFLDFFREKLKCEKRKKKSMQEFIMHAHKLVPTCDEVAYSSSKISHVYVY